MKIKAAKLLSEETKHSIKMQKVKQTATILHIFSKYGQKTPILP